MAAQLQIPCIPPFSPHGDQNQVAQKWTKWKKSFQYFLTASVVIDGARKKALLLHLISEQSQDIFETLGVPDDATYDATLTALEEHFKIQKNVPYERSVFHSAKQRK